MEWTYYKNMCIGVGYSEYCCFPSRSIFRTNATIPSSWESWLLIAHNLVLQRIALSHRELPHRSYVYPPRGQCKAHNRMLKRLKGLASSLNLGNSYRPSQLYNFPQAYLKSLLQLQCGSIFPSAQSCFLYLPIS